MFDVLLPIFGLARAPPGGPATGLSPNCQLIEVLSTFVLVLVPVAVAVVL